MSYKLVPTQAERNLNEGHGHVFLRPDGLRMRCGGRALCPDCAKDFAALQSALQMTPEQAARVLLNSRLSRKAVYAALIGHYGKRAEAIGIKGVDLTSNGKNWTFDDGFRRMWRGALRAIAGEDV